MVVLDFTNEYKDEQCSEWAIYLPVSSSRLTARRFLWVFTGSLGIGTAPEGTRCPATRRDVGGNHLYEIERCEQLSEYIGKLVVEWGEGKRAWVQLAHLKDKTVVAIRKEVREEPFPGFTYFCWDINEINSVALLWQEVLRNVKGVYLLTCSDTGKHYVGSAKGAESLWGRFVEHAKTGFGDSVKLTKLGSPHLQVSVLEVVNSDIGIERVEEAWMTKLMTRKFGLN